MITENENQLRSKNDLSHQLFYALLRFIARVLMLGICLLLTIDMSKYFSFIGLLSIVIKRKEKTSLQGLRTTAMVAY